MAAAWNGGNEKLRGSHHSGRTNSKGQAFNVNHNDRKFKQEKSAGYDRHIDTSRSDQNRYSTFKMEDPAIALSVDPERFNLRNIELNFYKKHFGAHLEQTNAKYVKNRHRERVRTIEDVYTNPRTCPQETILQVGKDGDYQNEKLFRRMVSDYCSTYNEKYSRNSMIIDYAIHADETSLHAHVRRVFYVRDKDGNFELAQNKALEQLGYDLPDPGQKRSKYNNRLQTFTDDLRESWYQTIEKYDKSVKIEREPNNASRKHVEKLDYQKENAREQLDIAKKECDLWNSLSEERKEELLDLERKYADRSYEVERMDALQKIAEEFAGEEPTRKVRKQLIGKGSVIEDVEPEEINDMFRAVAQMDATALRLSQTEEGLEKYERELKKQQAQLQRRDQLQASERREIIEERERFEQEKEQFGKNRYAQGFNDGKESRRKEIIRFLKVISEYQHLERTYPDVEKALKQARDVEEFKKRMEELEKSYDEYKDGYTKDDDWDWDFER